MKKRVLSIVICLVLVLCSLAYIAPDTSVSAAGKVKLNATKKTLYVGDKFELKLNNATGTVKFSSSNKKVVKVSSQGVVTAVAEGKATVKVKNNKKTYKCKFTVKEDNRYIVDKINDRILVAGDGEYKIKLSGKKEDHVVTDRLCYVEGKKCVICLDKDIELPGDFVDNVDLIMTTLEEMTGLSFADSLKSKWALYAPWENIDFGKKIPIFVFTDRNDEAYISYATHSYCTLVSNQLISQKVWDSVPSYRDEAWRRNDRVYETAAHELTHVLTLRHAVLSDIMTEGSAEYYAEEVMKKLSDKDAEFKECYEKMMEVRSTSVEKKITKDNMESMFINDYQELDMINRDDKYILGRIICEYLSQSYGEKFLKDYIDALAKAHYTFDDDVWSLTNDQLNDQAKIFKKLFGKKVFEKFAVYYNKVK